MRKKRIKKITWSKNLDEATLQAVMFSWKSRFRMAQMLNSRKTTTKQIADEFKHQIKLGRFIDHLHEVYLKTHKIK